MPKMVAEEQQWYVQKGSRVQGPFSTTEVGRYLLLGRVRNTDRVSKDGELWEPVTQVPELIPEELLDLDSEKGWEAYMSSHSQHDERRQPSQGRMDVGRMDVGSVDPASAYPDSTDVGGLTASTAGATDALSASRHGVDRRELDVVQAASAIRDDWSSSQAPALTAEPLQQPRKRSVSLLPLSLLGLTLTALLLVIYLNSNSSFL